MSDTTDALTLAIPYYSQPAFLLRTVSSVVAQRGCCALLIVDDSPAGLDVETRTAIEGIVGNRLEYQYRRTNGAQGMAAAWNRCLDEATTDLVTLVHGDDELERDYAPAMIALAARHPDAAAVFCGASIIDGRGNKRFSFADWYKAKLTPAHDDELVLRGDFALQSLLRGNYLFCPTLCYRRSVIANRRFDARYRFVLDLDFVTRILLDGGTIVGVPRRAHYRYRRHADNATAVLTRELTRFREESAFYAQIAEQCQRAGCARASAVARAGLIIRMNLAFCMARDFGQLRVRAGIDKFKLLAEMQFGRLG